MQEYRGIASRLILPHLGSIALAKLRPAHIAEWAAMLRERGGQNGRPLSTKSTHHAFSLLNGALRWGVRMELIGRNVCEAVTAPVPKRSDAKAMTAEEMGRVLEAAVDTRWAAFLALAFSLGMRRGELCALSWSDVNFTDATLTVRHSLSETKRGGIVLKTTKSNKTRTLPLSRVALEACRSQHALQAKEKIAAGGAYQDNGAIFADELGQRITPMTATCAFKRIAQRAKVTTTRLHDTRHTAATAMLTGGVDVRTVAGVLGHSSANITLATYAHLLADSQREALDRLGERVEKAARDGAVQADGHRMVTVATLETKKPHNHAIKLVAPTGIEPVFTP